MRSVRLDRYLDESRQPAYPETFRERACYHARDAVRHLAQEHPSHQTLLEHLGAALYLSRCSDAGASGPLPVPHPAVYPRVWETGAHLLRDVVGNPYRPATLEACSRCDGHYKMRWIDDAEHGICPWCVRGSPLRTPDVLTLARAAYDRRLMVACSICDGRGLVFTTAASSESGHSSWDPCRACGGRKATENATLDPMRLLVLSDALEEAGCTDALILGHLRGRITCPGCSGRGWWTVDSNPRDSSWTCTWCQGTGVLESAPHVRGCWVLDLILRLE